MNWHLFLDENISPDVAQRLRELGYDVVPIRERRRLLGDEDWNIMKWCLEHDRTIVTKNERHFRREHERCQERGELHPGILVCGDWATHDIYWGLLQFLETHSPNDVLNVVHTLAPADYGHFGDLL